MLQQQVYIINTFLMVIDAICIIVAGYGAYYIKYYTSRGLWTMDTIVFVGSVLLVMFANNYIMAKFDLYGDRRPASFLKLLEAIFKSVFADFAILATCIFLLKIETFSRLFLLSFAVNSFVLLLFHRILSQLYFNKISKRGFHVRKILVLGEKKRGQIVSETLKSQLSMGHIVLDDWKNNSKNFSNDETIGSIEDLSEILKQNAIDEVVFAFKGDRSVDLTVYLDLCRQMGVSVRILPALWKPEEQTLSIEKCQNLPFLTIQTDNFNATGLLYKRILDIVGGFIGTFIFTVVYPFVAIAIKIDSKGSVIFKQKRMGQHGRVFNLLKFRTMVEGAETEKGKLLQRNMMEGAIFKLKNDPRITRIGRWLRNTSLDELPQFINVLKGEMSLVGTRPPTLDEVENYKPQHLKRISAKPGITGLWQISGRNKIVDFEKIVELDCQYLDQWRFLDDLKILIKTIFVVILRKGAI